MATLNNTLNVATGGQKVDYQNITFYQRTLMDRLLPELIMTKYAEKSYKIPKKSGDTTQWRKFNSLAVSTTALTEGVTPDGINATVTQLTATVKQYGSYMQTTDQIDLMGLDPVVTEFSELLGEQAGLTTDTIVRDIVVAGTNVMYAGGRVSRATITSADKITALDILKLKRQFRRNKVKPIKTPNGKNAYICFAHTDVLMDIMQLQEWKDQNTYVNTDNRVEGTVGQLYGVYFIEYDNAVKFAGAGSGGADVFPLIAIGKGAYGITDIDGSAKPDMIVKGLGSSGTADPLNQRATVGWKNLFTAIRLEELAIIRFECSATA